MVARMRKWLPWPPNSSRKFHVFLTLHSMEGFPPSASSSADGIMVDVKWKGPKGSFFRRRSVKRIRTAEKRPTQDGTVTWEEETHYECIFTEAKNSNSSSTFLPWDVHFVVLKVAHQGAKAKLSVAGTAVMNISEYVLVSGYAPKKTRINVSGSVGVETDATLLVTVSAIEHWAHYESGEFIHTRPSFPCVTSALVDAQPHPECSSDRVIKNSKRPAEGKVSQELYVLDKSKLSSRSEGCLLDSRTLFESSSESVEEYGDERVEDDDVQKGSSFRKSFSYGTLAGVNLVLEGALPSFREAEVDKVASIHDRVVTDEMPRMNEEALTSSDTDQAVVQQTMRSLLSWKKRKLSFRSPRARGEPLLNKAYGDDGGDDIDHDRRQSCASPTEQYLAMVWKDESTSTSNVSGSLDFGDEKFSVGCWERKEFISRDGRMKLSASVFFASIDQRDERAAGESACTALVAAIAEWLHRNPDRMPIRTEFDSLIREGSAEWRRLCENETYRSRFPDGHFDLETVLEAQVRPLKIAADRSYIGFFQPEELLDVCDFLQGAMLFDNIWDAIIKETSSKASSEPAIYIVSWNDHFFILKVDPDACYIIDTLGERLQEGCDQAYIIRFDKEATIGHAPKESTKDAEKTEQSSQNQGGSSAESSTSRAKGGREEKRSEKQEEGDGEEDDAGGRMDVSGGPVYVGMEACKCFLKEFFAAVPLRELQVDIKKGLLGTLTLHRRLQIEFHYMSFDGSSMHHQLIRKDMVIGRKQ